VTTERQAIFKDSSMEVRLSAVARSTDWIAAQHRSMTDQFID
jgi:hypothetical protein